MLGTILLNGTAGLVMIITFCFCITDLEAVLSSETGFPFIPGNDRIPITCLLYTVIADCTSFLQRHPIRSRNYCHVLHFDVHEHLQRHRQYCCWKPPNIFICKGQWPAFLRFHKSSTYIDQR